MNDAKVKEFKGVADQLGVSRTVLALAWCAAQPGVSSVILGASRLEQLEENLKALDVEISEDVSKEINRIFND